MSWAILVLWSVYFAVFCVSVYRAISLIWCMWHFAGTAAIATTSWRAYWHGAADVAVARHYRTPDQQSPYPLCKSSSRLLILRGASGLQDIVVIRSFARQLVFYVN